MGEATRKSVFAPEFREDLVWWIDKERKTALRVMRLVEDVMRNPFSGIGKPEPLRHMGPGVWSRRITREHRLVYIVYEGTVDFLQARYHY